MCKDLFEDGVVTGTRGQREKSKVMIEVERREQVRLRFRTQMPVADEKVCLQGLDAVVNPHWSDLGTLTGTIAYGYS
jgi:hypothetical protein